MSSADWLAVVIGMIGGLVFFLFGMNVMSGSLEKMTGGKLEHMLKKMTANPYISILLGAAITIAVQSSSATTVMLVGLVNSGLMTMSQTLYVIYGANIGTTFTSWILSLAGIESSNVAILMLKPGNFAPVLALVGIAMLMLAKNDRKKSVGTVFVGFSVLIYGMEMMGDAAGRLADLPGFGDLLGQFSNPLVSLLIGTLFTAVIQSSAATIGIVQTFALQGLISNGMALPLVMGANIGTCVTSLISCIGTNRHAKRVAVLHLSMNVIGTVVWLGVYMLVTGLVEIPFFLADASPFSVAVCHSIFNVLTAALLLPMNRLMERIAVWLVPDKGAPAKKDELLLDVRLLKSPSVAVEESFNASVKMCTAAYENVLCGLELLTAYDSKKAAAMDLAEDLLDEYEDKLGTYLVQLSSESLSKRDSLVVSKVLHAIGDFERLGDHALNLRDVATEIHEKGITFTEQAQHEIATTVGAIREILRLMQDAYCGSDLQVAMQVEPLEQVIDDLTARTRDNHIQRLRSGNCTIEMGFVLSDMLTNFERISDHCSNIAVAVIEVEHNSFDTHRYLNDIKHDNAGFEAAYEQYARQFAL